MKKFYCTFKVVTFLFSLLLLSSILPLTHGINVDLVSAATDTFSYTPPIYMVSCNGREQSDVLELDCMWGECTIYRESFGYYVVKILRLCSDMVCRIIEDGDVGYKISVDEPSDCGCNEWRIEKQEGGNCWVLIQDGAEDYYWRRVYIRKIPQSNRWQIDREILTPSGDVLNEKIATMDFAENMSEEIINLVNFVVSIPELF